MTSFAPVCLLLLGLLFVTVKSHTTACNHGNNVTCLYGNATFKGVRQLMNNTDKFWFGTQYNESCPGDDDSMQMVECFNPAPEMHSIIERLRFAQDSNTDNIDQYLRVHYGVPAGMYHACHSRIPVPATDKHIDPVHSIYNDAWALNHRPHVTWQSVPDVKTTLVFWDAGWFQLQGLWINNAGTSLMDGTEVIPYSGPMNPLSRKNPVVFALFRQSGEAELNVQTTYSTVQNLTHATSLGIHTIKMSELMATLDLEGPIAVSIIVTSVTPYSAQYGRQKHIVNSCPYLRTSVMRKEKESLPWNTTETELSVTVDVSYNSEPTTFKSCCQQHTSQSLSTYLDSRAREPIDSVHLRDIPYHVTLVPTHIRDEPYYFSHPDRMFTLLMLDVTDSAHNMTDRATVHWQVINIHDAQLTTGLTTVQYKAPHVAMPSPERRFVFLLLKQSGSLDAMTAKYTPIDCDTTSSRCVFDLTKFMRERGVKIAGMSMLRARQDLYSRMQTYTNLGGNKGEACLGVDGFSDPCPTPQTCDGAGVISLPSLFALVMLGLVVSLRP